MERSVLKEMGFSDVQIDAISEPEYIVIQNFFNSQEISNIDKDQVIAAAKILAPVFKNLKIVDMFDYINKTKQSDTSDENKVDSNLFLVSNKSFSSERAQERAKIIDSFQTKEKTTKNEFDKYVRDRYIVQQVWILEYLVNNPNLLSKDDNIEKVKRYLREKELELNLHNIILKKFFEAVNVIGDIYTVLNFKHFESIKKDIANRLIKFQNNPPLDFKGVVEILQDFGFEEQQELNEGICSALAELVKEPKLQKLINFSMGKLNEVDLATEKKKVLRKIFKEK